MKIGILGTADIAFRRFIPALKKVENITYIGVASRMSEKGERFQKTFGGRVYESYDALLHDPEIEAVYVPLPPALHFEWGMKVLKADKHLLLEKPFTTTYGDTETLVAYAKSKHLIVQENYMFIYHKQFEFIKRMISDGELGDLRLVKASFGFPKRSLDDFRYNKALGGGALLDCGGYPVRVAMELLGESTKVSYTNLSSTLEYDVDLYGNAVLENDEGLVAQISFGMDNAYQCQLEVWGSKATLIAPRIFTAGADISPTIIIKDSSSERKIDIECDDQFMHSIEHFYDNVVNKRENYSKLLLQAKLVSAIQQ